MLQGDPVASETLPKDGRDLNLEMTVPVEEEAIQGVEEDSQCEIGHVAERTKLAVIQHMCRPGTACRRRSRGSYHCLAPPETSNCMPHRRRMTWKSRHEAKLLFFGFLCSVSSGQSPPG